MFLFFLFALTSVVSLKSNLFYNFTPKIAEKSLMIQSKNECKYGIIVFPGYGKDAKSYENLCIKINEKMNDEVTFLIMDYTISIPFHPEEQANYIGSKCVDYLKKHEANCDKILFMGHSAGAYYAIEPAEKYSDGLIQLGCVLNSRGDLKWKSRSLQKYSKPVLTLLGQKDGYLNYLLSIQEYKDLLPEHSLYKPIVIEEGVNHLQMSDNIETGFARILKKKDIYSELSLEEAHDKLSDTIASFLQNTTMVQRKHLEGYNKIARYLSLYENLETIPEQCQLHVMNFKLDVNVPIKSIQHTSKKGFLYSKPFIDDDGTITVQSYLSEMNTNKLYSDCMWVKMKNQQALSQHPKYQYVLFDNEQSAKDMNKKMFENYLNGSCPANIVFEDDKLYKDEVSSSLSWINDDIRISYNNEQKTLFIQSPTLYTDMTMIPRYAGMYYMKILTPQLIEELINLYF